MSYLDHIAFRLQDKDAATSLLSNLIGYSIGDTFQLNFDNGSKADCNALELEGSPEIFVSHGTDDSIVGQWVKARNGLGGVHHLAVRLDSLEELQNTVKEWRSNGLEFASEDILFCENEELWQIFTKPLAGLGDIIIELIVRGPKNPGFCQANVQNLMENTKDFT